MDDSLKCMRKEPAFSGTRLAWKNLGSGHGGCKWARNHSAAEIARYFAPRPPKQSRLRDFWGCPQNRRKHAATTAASRCSRVILRPQQPWDTKHLQFNQKFLENTLRITQSYSHLLPRMSGTRPYALYGYAHWTLPIVRWR